MLINALDDISDLSNLNKGEREGQGIMTRLLERRDDLDAAVTVGSPL